MAKKINDDPALEYNIVAYIGRDFARHFFFLDADGLPIDISGWSGYATVREGIAKTSTLVKALTVAVEQITLESAVTVGPFTVAKDTTLYAFKVSAARADTVSWTEATRYWAFVALDDGGLAQTRYSGRFEIKDDPVDMGEA